MMKYRVMYEIDLNGKQRQVLIPYEGELTETLELDYSGTNLIPSTELEVSGATETIVESMQESSECLEEVIPNYTNKDLQQDTDVEHIDTETSEHNPSTLINEASIAIENDGSVQEYIHTTEGDITTMCISNNQTTETTHDITLSSTVSSGIDFVTNPDFSKQEYYNWLTRFTELCKVVPMPLETSLFQKISQVHKTVSDVMATPSGVVADKENFVVLMNITKELSNIINEHLMFVMQNLNKSGEHLET